MAGRTSDARTWSQQALDAADASGDRLERCRALLACGYARADEHLPAALEGRDFSCTCPEGPHGFYMFLEGEIAEDVIRGLPPEWRRGTEAYPVEVFRLASR